MNSISCSVPAYRYFSLPHFSSNAGNPENSANPSLPATPSKKQPSPLLTVGMGLLTVFYGIAGMNLLLNKRAIDPDTFQVVQNRLTGDCNTYIKGHSKVIWPVSKTEVFPIGLQRGEFQLSNIPTQIPSRHATLKVSYSFFVAPPNGEQAVAILERCPNVAPSNLAPKEQTRQKINWYIQKELSALQPEIEQYLKEGAHNSFSWADDSINPLALMLSRLSKKFEENGINLTIITRSFEYSGPKQPATSSVSP